MASNGTSWRIVPTGYSAFGTLFLKMRIASASALGSACLMRVFRTWGQSRMHPKVCSDTETSAADATHAVQKANPTPAPIATSRNMECRPALIVILRRMRAQAGVAALRRRFPALDPTSPKKPLPCLIRSPPPVVREHVISCPHDGVAREPALGVVRLRWLVGRGGRRERIGRSVVPERAPSPSTAVRE